MPSKLTVKQFFARFPDDDACLNHIMDVRFGKKHTCKTCGVDATFHKLANRRAYSCAQCGAHLYPCAGTIFQDSRTSLQSWFYAIYLFVATRHGVSAKELERSLGVTYKTAWRMGQQIRKLMDSAQGFGLLQGHIEIDEAYVGGHRPGKRGRGAAGKTIVVGMKEREGDIRAQAVPDAKKDTLRSLVTDNVQPGAIVSTDEFVSYGLLTPDGYQHGVVKHGVKEFAYYDYRHKAVHHTNGVESFWKLFKNSIRSTHIHVSQKYMDRYLAEFTYLANHRQMENAMLDLLLAAL